MKYDLSRDASYDYSAGGIREVVVVGSGVGVYEASDLIGTALEVDTTLAFLHLHNRSNNTLSYQLRWNHKIFFVNLMCIKLLDQCARGHDTCLVLSMHMLLLRSARQQSHERSSKSLNQLKVR